MDEKKFVTYTKVCPICKKAFVPAPMHAWKIGGSEGERLVCGYHCMRQWEAVHGGTRKNAKRKKG